MENRGYFDNSATTKPCREAAKAVMNAVENGWGNPSSLHFIGSEAESILEDARASVAGALSCKKEEIYFTSGGTESNNLAVFGAAHKMRRLGRRIVSTAIEHPSVDSALDALAAEGFEIIKIKTDRYGRVDEKDIFEAVNSDTILVTMMLVNNELGSVLPVRSIRKAVARAKAPALIHCDAVQAFGKIPVKPASLGADLLTVSSHKIHGPKGAGALYIKSGVKIQPRAFGGEQEMRMRPGTQAMPAIAGFGAAAKAIPDYKQNLEKAESLRAYMLGKFEEAGGIVINSAPDALPYVTNISVPGIKSEPMLNFLSSKGICVSSGSACSKGKKSRVLSATGLEPEAIESALRISFSRFTTESEIDYLAEMIKLGQSEIRKIR